MVIRAMMMMETVKNGAYPFSVISPSYDNEIG